MSRGREVFFPAYWWWWAFPPHDIPYIPYHICKLLMNFAPLPIVLACLACLPWETCKVDRKFWFHDNTAKGGFPRSLVCGKEGRLMRFACCGSLRLAKSTYTLRSLYGEKKNGRFHLAYTHTCSTHKLHQRDQKASTAIAKRPRYRNIQRSTQIRILETLVCTKWQMLWALYTETVPLDPWFVHV